VRARLGFAAAAIVAIAALLVVGLFPSAARRTPKHSSATASQRTAASASPTSSASPSGSTTALTANMHMVFSANFYSPQLDTSLWDTCYPWANMSQGCTNFSNQEAQWYLPSQVRISGGALNLVAQPIQTRGLNADGTPEEYACRSGMVTSWPGFNFQYGYLQVVADIPNGVNTWPAIWLAASDLKWPPEIDILEHWGAPVSHSGVFLHPLGSGPVSLILPGATSAALINSWHTYGIYWTPSQLKWYVDGKVVLTVDQNIPHQRMYFIANLAAYRDNGLAACGGMLQIRSVQAWQS
jgi:beta-glucanase (GH16 family)